MSKQNGRPRSKTFSAEENILPVEQVTGEINIIENKKQITMKNRKMKCRKN